MNETPFAMQVIIDRISKHSKRGSLIVWKGLDDYPLIPGDIDLIVSPRQVGDVLDDLVTAAQSCGLHFFVCFHLVDVPRFFCWSPNVVGFESRMLEVDLATRAVRLGSPLLEHDRLLPSAPELDETRRFMSLRRDHRLLVEKMLTLPVRLPILNTLYSSALNASDLLILEELNPKALQNRIDKIETMGDVFRMLWFDTLRNPPQVFRRIKHRWIYRWGTPRCELSPYFGREGRSLGRDPSTRFESHRRRHTCSEVDRKQ